MVPKVFLIGGGWRAEFFPETYGRFLEAAGRGGESRIAIIVAEEEGADPHVQFWRFFEEFAAVGLKTAETEKVIVSAENALTKKSLAEIKPTGVFVCGGLTPAYFESLCLEKSWLEYLSENRLPYCGFSAGAAIASKKAVIGGWRRDFGGRLVQIADENAGEDLDLLTVENGLGLVDFSVDVYAAQWGTLSRLAHAIDARFADEGWAIDEDTMLEADVGGKIEIFGAGSAYRIRRSDGRCELEIFQAELLSNG
jgi:cyanophycinase